MEDCLESWPPQVLAASSNTALADLGESLDSVSTYMAASSRRQNEMARLEDTGWLPVLAREARLALSLLRSAWQPTSRRLAVKLERLGTQWRRRLWRLGGDIMLKHNSRISTSSVWARSPSLEISSMMNVTDLPSTRLVLTLFAGLA